MGREADHPLRPGLKFRPREATPSVVREVGAGLSQLPYRGVPIGPALKNCLVVMLLWEQGDWRLRTKWVNRATRLRHFPRPRHGDTALWSPGASPNPHDMAEVDSAARRPARSPCTQSGCVPPRCDGWPRGRGSADATKVSPLSSKHAMCYGPSQWPTQYARCRPDWSKRPTEVWSQYDLPAGADELPSLQRWVASHGVDCAQGLLEQVRPSVVLIEHARQRAEGAERIVADRGTLRTSFSPANRRHSQENRGRAGIEK